MVLKISCFVALVVAVLITRYFLKANNPTVGINLDDLATLELPKSFHQETSHELNLPTERRLLRKPYRNANIRSDQITYYLMSHDYYHMGGREIPALLRITLYANETVVADVVDSGYIQMISKHDFHHDGQKAGVYARFQQVANSLFYTEELQTKSGWFSLTTYKQMHFILTDIKKKIRLFFSVSEREMSREAAEQFMAKSMQTLERKPENLAQFFGYTKNFLQNKKEIEKHNYASNLRVFNQQLSDAGLPAIDDVDRCIDTGKFFYGVNERNEVFFAARLGNSPQSVYPVEPYFSNTNVNGRYLLSQNQQTILKSVYPEGTMVHLRSSVSENLSFPPEEFIRFQLKDIFRETDESIARLRKNKGFDAQPLTEKTDWLISRVESQQSIASAATWTDYRWQQIRFPSNVSPLNCTIRYVGIRRSKNKLPEAVFMVSSAEGINYFSVDVTRGGQLNFPVATARYQVDIEPPEKGRLKIQIH